MGAKGERKEMAARLLAGAGGAERSTEAPCEAPCPYDNARGRFEQITPVALRVHKRGRPCVVAKIVPLNGEVVLGVCWRYQRGTRRAVSVPLSALAYAEAHGARRFVLKNERLGVMKTIPFAEMRRKGWIGADGENYIRLADMTPCPWAPWPYAERTVALDEAPAEAEPEPAAVQSVLWEGRP